MECQQPPDLSMDPSSCIKIKVMTLKEVLSTLQTLGEVNVKLSMHDMSSSNDQVKFNQSEPVCFVLDVPKEKRKKVGYCL